jgi:DnaJ-class molecular chaperone
MIKSCEYDNDMALIRKICPTCYGKGYYRDHIHDGYCWKCNGKGYIDEEE